MVAKALLLFSAQLLLVQYISTQCIGAYSGLDGLGWGPAPFGAPWNAGLPYAGELPLAGPWGAAPCAEWASGFDLPPFIPSSGGSFPVTSASPIPVTGISLTSENVYEGPLAVSGAVPFLAAVALEGALPTAGAGAITYNCGNGNVAMLSEDLAGFNGYAGPYGYGPGPVELGYGYGTPLGYEDGLVGPYGLGYNRGCGCGY